MASTLAATGSSLAFLVIIIACAFAPRFASGASSPLLIRGGTLHHQPTKWGDYGGKGGSSLSVPRRFLVAEAEGAEEYGYTVQDAAVEPQPDELTCPVRYSAMFTVAVKGSASEGVPALIQNSLLPAAVPSLASAGAVLLVDSVSLPDPSDDVLPGSCGTDLASATTYSVFTFQIDTWERQLLHITTDYILESLTHDVIANARLCGLIITPSSIGSKEDCSDPSERDAEGTSEEPKMLEEASSVAPPPGGTGGLLGVRSEDTTRHSKGRRYGRSRYNSNNHYNNNNNGGYSPPSGSGYGTTGHYGQRQWGGSHSSSYQSSSSAYHGSSAYGGQHSGGGYHSTYRNPPGNSYSQRQPAYAPPSSYSPPRNYGNRYQPANGNSYGNVWSSYWGAGYGRH